MALATKKEVKEIFDALLVLAEIDNRKSDFTMIKIARRYAIKITNYGYSTNDITEIEHTLIQYLKAKFAFDYNPVLCIAYLEDKKNYVRKVSLSTIGTLTAKDNELIELLEELRQGEKKYAGI